MSYVITCNTAPPIDLVYVGCLRLLARAPDRCLESLLHGKLTRRPTSGMQSYTHYLVPGGQPFSDGMYGCHQRTIIVLLTLFLCSAALIAIECGMGLRVLKYCAVHIGGNFVIAMLVMSVEQRL